MTIYVKETRELRHIALTEWDGAQWSSDMAGDIMIDVMSAPALDVPEAAYELMTPEAARVCDASAHVVSQETLDWWAGEVDAYNARKRSRLMSDEYDDLTADDIADYYAGRPADDRYALDSDLLCRLSESETRRIIAATDFRGLLRLVGLTQSQCAKRFDIPLRTVQGWCSSGGSSGAARRECPTYVRLMIAECMGVIGKGR